MERNIPGVSKKVIRRYARILARLKTLIKAEHEGGKNTFYAETKNVSRGGVCVEVAENTKDLLETLDGKSLRLKISLNLREEESQTVQITGRTAWIGSTLSWLMTPSSHESPVLMGLAFTALDESDAKKIDAFTLSSLERKKEAIYRKRIDGILARKNERE